MMLINNRWIIIFMFSSFLIFQSEGFSPLGFITKNYHTSSLNTITQSFSTQAVNSVELEDFIQKNLKSSDPLKNLYAEPATQWLVEDFLTRKIGSEEIVNTILLYVSDKKLSIKTVFSLVFVESSYSQTAVGYNKTSSDRGLFQLNSNTFRHLDPEEFFHLDTNVKMGTSYLEYAFSLDPDPNIALAIYNAGPSRPLKGLTPESTKAYVKKILTQERILEEQFMSYVREKLHHARENHNRMDS